MEARHQISRAVMPGAKKRMPGKITKSDLNDICEKKVEKRVAAR